ncbi:hypothetical protein [Poseidonibacter ostreae]|uniref:Uncharacterized protein n=1 Tax=Poseidonibacter ostreae TaxID=2654171 RepID=A0A6L4WW98_9BACT|nr:hypothetical protein [Poseidonibacter ostreae]KAB7891332.1 hypothetical protein GBG19_00415 [Poseidonibacter ostreae]
MKKILLLLFAIIQIVSADITLTKDSYDALLQKEVSVATAITSQIEDTGIVPSTIADLITNGYLPSDFSSENLIDGNNVSFVVDSTSINIDTNVLVSGIDVAEKEYYLNNISDNTYAKDTFSSTTLSTKYYLQSKALNILKTASSVSLDFIGDREPNTYATPSANEVWYDSNIKDFNIKRSDGIEWADAEKTNQNENNLNNLSNVNALDFVNLTKSYSNVIVTEDMTPIACRNGSTYNQTTNRCEAFTSDACDGNYYDTASGLCYKRPVDYCKAIGFTSYDGSRNQCVKDAVIYFPIGSSLDTTSGFPRTLYRNGGSSGDLSSGDNWGRWNLGHGGGGCAGAGVKKVSIKYFNDSKIVVSYTLKSDYNEKAKTATVSKNTNFTDEWSYGRDVGRIRVDMRTGYVYKGYCKGRNPNWSIVGYLDGFPKKMTCGGEIFDSSSKITESLYYANDTGINSFIEKEGSQYTLDYQLSAGWNTKNKKVTTSSIYQDKLYHYDPKGSIETKFLFDALNKTFWVGSSRVGGSYKHKAYKLKDIQCFFLNHSRSCPSGSTRYGTSQCQKGSIEYADIPSSWSNGYVFSNDGINSDDAYIKTPSCSGKSMSVSPYSNTPTYGNNGICYSDVGTYCKTHSSDTSVIMLPNNKQVLCWDLTQNCSGDTSYNLDYNYSGTSDKCNKYQYTCPTSSRYGISEHKTISNKNTLFSNILNKDDKVLPYLSEIANKVDIDVNDNNGAMCIENTEIVYNGIEQTKTVDGKTKSIY